MPEIRFEDVTKIYPFQKVTGIFGRRQQKEILAAQMAMPYTSDEGVIAVQHCNLTIRNGEFSVIVGPSGSGKSTILRMIAGLEKPVLGQIFFDDKDMTLVPPEERDVAMVFQNYSLYPNQTVYKNVAFPLEVKHIPREEIEEKVVEICTKLGIEDKLESLPHDLSGGERQRVAIARAMVREPSVLLMDEPFSNLDGELKGKLRTWLKKLHGMFDTTFVYVTHDQLDALALADRVVVMKDGIVQMQDTPDMVYHHPVNEFVDEFFEKKQREGF